MLLVLGGLAAAVLLSLVAAILSVIGLATRTRARGIAVSWSALALVLVAAFLSTPLWLVIFRVRGTESRLTWRDDAPLYEIAVGEVVAILLSATALIRHHVRR